MQAHEFVRGIVKHFIGLLCLSLATIATMSTAGEARQLNYQIVAERSHKPQLFTQGLLVKNNYFYESTGLYGKSQVVSYPVSEPEGTWAKMTAPYTHKQALGERYFAEGLALLHNKLYLLTWQEQTVFVYDANTFSPITRLNYQGEGWGLTSDGEQLIRSDGSAELFFHKPEDFVLTKRLPVKLGNQSINNLNELEYIDGFIWANIWHDNRVIKINPKTGEVVAVANLTSLVEKLALKDPESVLNGIAYDADKKAIWITGKNWPKMYLVKFQ